jgi:Spy/CpxP family protein refolding chaperone
MKVTLTKFAVLAALVVTIPAAAVLAQAPDRGPIRPSRASPEMLERLHDGRLAMIRESLRLDDAQQKLWAPVEAQLRASFAARQQARADWRRARDSGGRDQLSLSDRLDRVSDRMTKRAERVKALADAFRPFYASLNDEQKAVAAVLLRRVAGGIWQSRRWMHGSGRGMERN